MTAISFCRRFAGGGGERPDGPRPYLKRLQKLRQFTRRYLAGLLIAMDATPFRPHGIISTVEAVDDRFARQAIDAAVIEDVANVAEQDDDGIFILLRPGEKDGGISRPPCPIRAGQWR